MAGSSGEGWRERETALLKKHQATLCSVELLMKVSTTVHFGSKSKDEQAMFAM